MEFKLNKIDTDIRKKIEEDRKTSKVHSGKSINVDKNPKDEHNNKNHYKNDKDKKQKRYITINGIKYTDEKIKIDVEKTENINILNSGGRILDTRK
ncbi:hypothetical protein [uncultured Clostridium sp.]|uniref:hypothetical protein n=1 Tax=uncultured Clostridium sp. TaxID=59620 RepID=UPI0025ECF739|nr:hypothetical protein [uncultured Clostridium sp.]